MQNSVYRPKAIDTKTRYRTPPRARSRQRLPSSLVVAEGTPIRAGRDPQLSVPEPKVPPPTGIRNIARLPDRDQSAALAAG